MLSWRAASIAQPLVPHDPRLTIKLAEMPLPSPRAAAPAGEDETVFSADGESRSVSVQTAYRDGEAQTVPYTPDVLPPAPGVAAPAVSRLTFLTYGGAPGKSLPVGRADVEAVEASLARAAVEASLPPMTDEGSFELRKRLMVKLESGEWDAKEAAANARNAATLALVEHAVLARAAERSFIAEQRVEALRASLAAENADAEHLMSARRIKTLRKLGRTRARDDARVDMLTGTGSCAGVGAVGMAAGRKKAGRDIISEFADHASRIYAPMLREGRAARGAPRNTLRLEATLAPGAPTAAPSLRAGAVLPELGSSAALAEFERSLQLASSLKAAASLPPSGVGRVTLGGAGAPTAAGGGAAAARAAQGAGGAAVKSSAATSRTAQAEEAVRRDLERVYAQLVTQKSGRSTTEVLNERLPEWRNPPVLVARPRTPVLDEGDCMRAEEVEDRRLSSLAAAAEFGSTRGGGGSGGGGGGGGDAMGSDVPDGDDAEAGGVGSGASGFLTSAPPLISTSAPTLSRFNSALILLQSVLRGRSVQEAMAEGKSRRYELLEEMRLDLGEGGSGGGGGGGVGGGDLDDVAREASEAAAAEHAAAVRRAAGGAAAGELAAAALDLLAKELTRRKELARLTGIAEAAAAERRRREGAERARRAAEAAERAEEEAAEAGEADVRGATAAALTSDALARAIAEHANAEAEAVTGIPAIEAAPIVARRDAEVGAIAASAGVMDELSLQVVGGREMSSDSILVGVGRGEGEMMILSAGMGFSGSPSPAHISSAINRMAAELGEQAAAVQAAIDAAAAEERARLEAEAAEEAAAIAAEEAEAASVAAAAAAVAAAAAAEAQAAADAQAAAEAEAAAAAAASSEGKDGDDRDPPLSPMRLEGKEGDEDVLLSLSGDTTGASLGNSLIQGALSASPDAPGDGAGAVKAGDKALETLLLSSTAASATSVAGFAPDADTLRASLEMHRPGTAGEGGSLLSAPLTDLGGAFPPPPLDADAPLRPTSRDDLVHSPLATGDDNTAIPPVEGGAEEGEGELLEEDDELARSGLIVGEGLLEGDGDLDLGASAVGEEGEGDVLPGEELVDDYGEDLAVEE